MRSLIGSLIVFGLVAAAGHVSSAQVPYGGGSYAAPYLGVPTYSGVPGIGQGYYSSNYGVWPSVQSQPMVPPQYSSYYGWSQSNYGYAPNYPSYGSAYYGPNYSSGHQHHHHHSTHGWHPGHVLLGN